MYKTLTVFFAVFIASALLLPAQSLVITAPNGGETLTLGQTFPIAWTLQNSTQKIRLILFQNGNRLGEIAENLSAGQSPYNWPVGAYSGATAPAGSGYTIRVRSMDNALDDYSNGPFTIAASGGTPASPPPPAPPAGLNVNQSGGLQMKPLKVNAQLVNYAVITSFTVDGKTDTSGEKIDCHLPLGIQCQVGVFSKTQPILYRYKLIIYEQSSGMSHVVKLSPWLEQNSYKIFASFQEIINAAFPGGLSGAMPFSVFGSVGVEVKNATQAEQPQDRRMQIKLYLQ